MTDVSLKCKCGAVQGVAHYVTSNLGTRIVCCCNDCQAFASYLGDENRILDEYGGTDIFQMPISHIEITQGHQNIRCVRLTSKGMFRWYSDCCKTPIGNTLSAGMPFIGLIHNFIGDEEVREKMLGSVRSYVNTKFAKKQIPSNYNHLAFPIRIIFRTISKMIVWKLKGLNKSSSFFEENGSPCVQPTILK